MPLRELGAVGRGLGLLADTWTLLILQRAFLGVRRYAGWRATLDISDATLSARLRALVEAGLLETRPYRENGRERREYVLTERGTDTWKLLVTTWDWEKTWIPRQVPLPDIVHRACGAPTRPLLRCAGCGEPVGLDDTTLERVIGAPGLERLPRKHPRRTRGPLPVDPLSMFPGAMEILGDRWGATVLGATLAGVSSFTVFVAELGISPEVLSDRLRRFVELGVLTRTPSGNYRPTEKGRASFPIHACLVDWAQCWLGGDGVPADVVLRHRSCGAELRVRLDCRACGVPLDRWSVSPVQAH